MQGLFNSVRVNKKRNLEVEFRGTAKLAKMDLKMQELRRKMRELSSGEDSDEHSLDSSPKTSKNSTSSREKIDHSHKRKGKFSVSKSVSNIIIPQEFKHLQN